MGSNIITKSQLIDDNIFHEDVRIIYVIVSHKFTIHLVNRIDLALFRLTSMTFNNSILRT